MSAKNVPPHARVLTVRQPWASLIASGAKSLELRSWSTRYRGPLVIASSAFKRRGLRGPFGALICMVQLTNVRATSVDDRERSCFATPTDFAFAWELEAPILLEHVPWKGGLGLRKWQQEKTE